jgi:L-alanine-DL-glutamate epimerase-like enolase superfamily enzyme
MGIMVEFSLWNLPTAKRFIAALEELDSCWFEDPVMMDSLAVLQEWRERPGSPLPPAKHWEAAGPFEIS